MKHFKVACVLVLTAIMLFSYYCTLNAASVGDCIGTKVLSGKSCKGGGQYGDQYTLCCNNNACQQKAGDCSANNDGNASHRKCVNQKRYGTCQDQGYGVSCVRCSTFYCGEGEYYEMKMPNGDCANPCTLGTIIYVSKKCVAP